MLIDSTRQTVVIEDLELKESTSFLVNNLYGTVYEDDRVEEIVASMELCSDHLIGEIVRSWASEPESCPEDDDMLIPLVFDDDVTRCMDMSVDDSENEYFDVFVSYISDKFKEAVVKVQIFWVKIESVEWLALLLETIGSVSLLLSIYD